jgi:hypothetical protein
MFKRLLMFYCVALSSSNLSVFADGSRELADVNRKLWTESTRGNNLATGRKVIFSQVPSYKLTAQGGSDATDLTDGVLSSRKDDTIWFDSKAVGWREAASGVNLLIDLGKEQPVEQVVIRCLGGKSQNTLICPKRFDVFISKDGKKYYPAVTMQKLMPGEKTQSDFKNNFYLDESGTAWVYPFVLGVKADARYIGVKIVGDSGFVFADEIALMEATSSEQNGIDFNQAYKKMPEEFLIQGILVRPRLNKLAVSTDVLTPNSLIIEDMRDNAGSKKPAQLVIEVPEGITLEAPKSATQEKIICNGSNYSRFTLPLPVNRHQTEMLFFKAANPPVAGADAIFYVLCDGEQPIKQNVPVELITIPEVKPALKRLHVSLAWMVERTAREWPGFFDAWRKFGFNAVACFPRSWNADSTAEDQKFLDTARSNGLKIVMNESPFHVMAKDHKPGEELFSQIPGKKNSNLCPSYRGKLYDGEMARVAENVRKARPDYVFWDIECWYSGAIEAAQCSRCKAEQQASGKPMGEFLKDKGTESFKDLYLAVKKGSAGRPIPAVASYNHHAEKPEHQLIVDFNRIYPQYVNDAQPSLYVSGRARDVHNSIRANYKLLKSKTIIPWLTAGTYGEFEPYKLEQMILEALLNGACGITYYCYTDFDTPLDFYYHAKALAEIAPYEDLIMDGEILEPSGSNKQLTYSGVKKGGEMLLLIGNYQNVPGNTAYTAPFANVTQINDLRSGQALPAANPIKLDVPKDGIILLYIAGKE